MSPCRDEPALGDGVAWALAKSLLEPNSCTTLPVCVCKIITTEGKHWPVCSVSRMPDSEVRDHGVLQDPHAAVNQAARLWRHSRRVTAPVMPHVNPLSARPKKRRTPQLTVIESSNPPCRDNTEWSVSGIQNHGQDQPRRPCQALLTPSS